MQREKSGVNVPEETWHMVGQRKQLQVWHVKSQQNGLAEALHCI